MEMSEASGAGADRWKYSVRMTRRNDSKLLEAFADLVQRMPYAEIRVSDITRRASVSRSTFYEYFESKDALMLRSSEPLYSILADCAVGRCSPDRLRSLLAHLWDRRSLARQMLDGAIQDRLTRRLVNMTHSRLAESSDRARDSNDRRLHAIRSATSQLGLLRAWLKGEVSYELEPVLDLLMQSTLRSHV
jgi:AcrR family transcriptional regulator